MQRIWNSKQRIGDAAEARAAAHLKKAGLHLVETKFRCKCGEIDLIMQDGAQLVFVEVRFRDRDTFGTAAESVDYRKQRKLILSAEYYLRRRGPNTPCRFDVVGISGSGEVNWVRNAFGA